MLDIKKQEVVTLIKIFKLNYAIKKHNYSTLYYQSLYATKCREALKNVAVFRCIILNEP